MTRRFRTEIGEIGHYLFKVSHVYWLLVTMGVPDVDKVEAEYVVAGMVRARCGLVQTVEVEPISEDGKCAEEL